jgi:hypothetical protein
MQGGGNVNAEAVLKIVTAMVTHASFVFDELTPRA